MNIYAGTNENAHLSNFAKRPFTDDLGITYNTVEGAFQAAKINYSTGDNSDIAMELQTATGSQAKSLGRRIKGLNTETWDRNSSQIMKELIKESFIQNPAALQRLLSTGNSPLTHTQDKGKWKTQFPEILMEVRDELGGATTVTPQISIASKNYTRASVRQDPNTAYVFTENNHSITAFPNRQGGGSAIIRPEANAFAIVTKKKYDYNTKENLDYKDTPADFKEFTEVNTRLINELKNSGKTSIVFPQGFASDKAKLPTRFATWLQRELSINFGLVTQLNPNKTGLISKSVKGTTSVKTTPQDINPADLTGDVYQITMPGMAPFGVEVIGKNVTQNAGQGGTWMKGQPFTKIKSWVAGKKGTIKKLDCK
jgi:ribA/ribD-fused uncharacterized protein